MNRSMCFVNQRYLIHNAPTWFLIEQTELFEVKEFAMFLFFFSIFHILFKYKNPMDCSPPGSSVHGIFQARILEWVVIPFTRGSSQSRDWIPVSCIVGRFFTTKSPGKSLNIIQPTKTCITIFAVSFLIKYSILNMYILSPVLTVNKCI